MTIFKKAEDLSEFIRQQKKQGKKIGFVPTMGALHQGHISLINEARKENEIVACSIFVNPTQFNNAEDFRHYPITVEKDIELLLQAKCDLLFLPSVEEVYPPGYEKKHYELGSLESILEGSYRPGHFQGVCEVVDRLLQVISPDRLYMGQKDFQQCMVIRKLLELTGREENTDLRIIPTVRENDGLAMSSRNLRLDAIQRKAAPVIYRELSSIKQNLGKEPFDELKLHAKHRLEENGFVVDYVEIAETTSLLAARDLNKPLVVLTAATIGKIRLIDNLLLN
jgi:pantoate--beta-alanine ligase